MEKQLFSGEISEDAPVDDSISLSISIYLNDVLAAMFLVEKYMQ